MTANQLQKKEDFYLPILRLLDRLGGSATIEEIEQLLVDEFNITEADLAVVHEKSGRPIIPHRIAWARSFLKEAGFLANEQRGIWVLTESGRDALQQGDAVIRERVAASMRAYNLRRKAAIEARGTGEDAAPEGSRPDNNDAAASTESWSDELLSAMLKMDPSAFERLCL